MADPANSVVTGFLNKATEDLEDARTALNAGWRNVCARSGYFAAFHAAVAALAADGVPVSPDGEGTLSHKSIAVEWAGRLIYRRKRYPSELRTILSDLRYIRTLADYGSVTISERDAREAMRQATRIVDAVRHRLKPESS